MSGHDPFSGPEERPGNYMVSLAELTPEQRDQARRTVAKQARNSDDEHLILAALGLDQP